MTKESNNVPELKYQILQAPNEEQLYPEIHIVTNLK